MLNMRKITKRWEENTEEHECLVYFDLTTEDCKLCAKTVKPSSMKNHMERLHGDIIVIFA